MSGGRVGRPPKAVATGTNQIAKDTWRVVDERRERMGISMTNLAKAGGVAKSTISRWANGDAVPDFEAVYRIWLLLQFKSEPLDTLTGLIRDLDVPEGLREVTEEEAELLDLFNGSKDFRETVRRIARAFRKTQASGR